MFDERYGTKISQTGSKRLMSREDIKVFKAQIYCMFKRC